MSVLTDLPQIKLVKIFGSGLVVSEMVAIWVIIVQPYQLWKKWKFDTEDNYSTRVCVQLEGCKTIIIYEYSRINEGVVSKIINLNFDFLSKKVFVRISGSVLMPDKN